MPPLPPEGKKTGFVKVFLSWLKNNPVQSAIGSALVLVGVPMINGYYQNVFLPNLIPLNVVTRVAASNPSQEKSYLPKNGIVFSPLELSITVENPGKRKLHLLRSVWVGEVCSFADHATDKEGAIEESFRQTVQLNNQPYKDDYSQIYEGYTRVCRFIGTGRLLRDSSISPQETISSKLVIVYPTKIPYFNGAKKDVDFIRITSYIPSMTLDRDNLRAHLYFHPRKQGEPPDGVGVWAKREKGRFGICTLEDLTGNQNVDNMSIISRGDTILTVDRKQQVWCPVTGKDKEYDDVNITRSVTETWLRDRIVN